MSNHKEVIYGLYNDEEDLLKAVKKANSMDLSIIDVFTPFPVHGLDSALHLSESRLHQGGFCIWFVGFIDRLFRNDLDFYQGLAEWLLLVVSHIGRFLLLYPLPSK